MTIDVNVQGIAQLQARIDPSKFKAAISDIVFKVGNHMETAAKKNIQESVYRSPQSSFYSRTGNAQQSISLGRLGPNSVKVFMGASYGKYLEFGTGIYHTPDARTPWKTTKIPGSGGKLIYMRGMKARPFWRPAIKDTTEKIESIVLKIIKEI